MTVLLQLFWSFFQIGLFSIGGGYAAMPLIQHQVVDLHGWLTIAGICGHRHHLPDDAGADRHQLGHLCRHPHCRAAGRHHRHHRCVFPSCIIVLTLRWVYYRYRTLSVVQGVLGGLRPAVVAMIASAGHFHFGNGAVERRGGLAQPRGSGLDCGPAVCRGAVCAAQVEAQPIWVMVGTGVVGLGLYLIIGY